MTDIEKAAQDANFTSRMMVREVDVKAGLRGLLRMQSEVSAGHPPDIPEPGEEASPEQIRSVMLALSVELAELTQELDWKPWKQKERVDVEKVCDEFADVLAFLGLLVVYLGRLGATPEMLARAYRLKSALNIARLNGGVRGYTPRGSDG